MQRANKARYMFRVGDILIMKFNSSTYGCQAIEPVELKEDLF